MYRLRCSRTSHVFWGGGCLSVVIEHAPSLHSLCWKGTIQVQYPPECRVIVSSSPEADLDVRIPCADL